MAGLGGKSYRTHSATHLVTWWRLAVLPGLRRHVRRASCQPVDCLRSREGPPAAHKTCHEAMRLLEPCNRLSKIRAPAGRSAPGGSHARVAPTVAPGPAPTEQVREKPCQVQLPNTLPGFRSRARPRADPSRELARSRYPDRAPPHLPRACARGPCVETRPPSFEGPSEEGGLATRWIAVDATIPALVSRARSAASGTTSSAHQARRCRP